MRGDLHHYVQQDVMQVPDPPQSIPLMSGGMGRVIY